MFKGIKPIVYGGREVWPLIEGGMAMLGGGPALGSETTSPSGVRGVGAMWKVPVGWLDFN